MKRKIEIAFLIAIIALGLMAFLLTHKTTPREENVSPIVGGEITMRNVTNGTVHYRIKPSNSFGEPKGKVLEVGAIQSYRSKVPMDITYERLGWKSLSSFVLAMRQRWIYLKLRSSPFIFCLSPISCFVPSWRSSSNRARTSSHTITAFQVGRRRRLMQSP